MKVLVNGASGFIGSWLIRYLLSVDCNVVALSRTQSKRLPAHSRLVIYTEPEGRHVEILRAEKPDVYVSLDWDGVENIYRNDERQWSNIPRVLELVDACTAVGVAKFVGIGSQAEYGNLNRVISESDSCRPTTTYGRSKLELCNLSRNYLQDSSTSWTWVRIFSTFGPMDTGNWLINQAIDNFNHDVDLELTACEQEWSYLYVTDAVRAIGTIALSDSSSGIYNLGHHDAPILKNTVLLLKSLTDSSSSLNFGSVAYRDDQVMHLQPNVRKLHGLGWSPRVDLVDGLRTTVQWRRNLVVTDPFTDQILPMLSEL